MKRFFEKKELAFCLILIGLYVFLFSAFDAVSDMIGISKLITAVLGCAMAAFLLTWIVKNGLGKHCGLTGGSFPAKQYLCFVPLVILVSVNFWGGVSSAPVTVETGLFVLSMIAVGVLEELIFRGFLFRYLYRENRKWAVVISSLTFGFGHIVSLLNGAEVIPTLLQIVYASAGGFLFTVIFLCSGSLIPCIAAHCGLNALSIFGGEQSAVLEMVSAGALTAVAALYGAWILWKERSNGRTDRIL